LRSFRKAESASDKALDDSGYTAAKAIEDELDAAADAIEHRMAEMVPTTLAGVRTLADLAENRWGSTDERDQHMLDRIFDALETLPVSPIKAIVLAFAERADERYHDEFVAPRMLRAIVIAIDAVLERVGDV
jgi:hypothetical protein